MKIKYKVITKKPKPYLKRVFKLDYFGGFVGYHYGVIVHELPNDETTIFFFVDESQESITDTNVMDGDYFEVYINHYDKHGNLNQKESLCPIKVG